MSYSGYLIKVGSYTIDAHKYIRAESYQVTKNIQDLDSYRDANGVLHRTVVDNAPLKVEFETPAMLTNEQMSAFMNSIRGNFSVSKERKASVTCYVPETDSYITQDMYMVDPQFKMYTTHDGVIRYSPIRIAFIGY